MHIQSVELKDCAFSPDTRWIKAVLLMHAGARRLHMCATANYQDGMHRDDMINDLLEDALRQLRRMPEFRDSTRLITVADDALPQVASLPRAV